MTLYLVIAGLALCLCLSSALAANLMSKVGDVDAHGTGHRAQAVAGAGLFARI